MKARVTVTSSRRGTSIHATGSAAQALFDALTKPPEQRPARVDCGECPCISTGCIEGQCMRAQPKALIGPADC